MKIRIIGSCGSGKSSLSREISKHYGIPYYELDNIIWDRSTESLKYPEEIRNKTLKEIIVMESWIIEGVQFKDWTIESISQSDIIFILNPNVYIRDYRIIKRFIKSRTGIEPWNYKQSINNLIKMIVKWNHGFKLEELLKETNKYQNKRHIVKNKQEILKII
jgi:adenylate kinase family enzyme